MLNLKRDPDPTMMEPFERAEMYGYQLVSSEYLHQVEAVVEAARRAYFDPGAEFEVEDALARLGVI